LIRAGASSRIPAPRQVILDRKGPPLLWVLLDEGLLHRPIGTPAVMYAQLLRPAELCEKPYVTLQVIPFSAGGTSACSARS
jgi:Domain of unknown function (DUF5753)